MSRDPASDAGVAPDAPAAACTNCYRLLPMPRPAFCPACGQETRVRAPRLVEFVQQFGGAYLATEGALWRTLKLLLLRPGELTRQYLAGRRRHHVLPLRLYLTISLIVLLGLRLSADVGAAGEPVMVDTPAAVSLSIGPGSAGLRDGKFFCERLPDWLCQRLQRRLDGDPAQLQREARALGERFVGNVGGAMFLLLPAFALGLQLVHPGRGLRYTEHLVFALHVHAFWFLMLALVLSGLPGVVVPALLAVPVYTLLAMRRVYGGGWPARLLRAALVSVLYGATLALALAGVALWSLLV